MLVNLQMRQVGQVRTGFCRVEVGSQAHNKAQLGNPMTSISSHRRGRFSVGSWLASRASSADRSNQEGRLTNQWAAAVGGDGVVAVDTQCGWCIDPTKLPKPFACPLQEASASATVITFHVFQGREGHGQALHGELLPDHSISELRL